MRFQDTERVSVEEFHTNYCAETIKQGNGNNNTMWPKLRTFT